jgi:hypothetical protein
MPALITPSSHADIYKAIAKPSSGRGYCADHLGLGRRPSASR